MPALPANSTVRQDSEQADDYVQRITHAREMLELQVAPQWFNEAIAGIKARLDRVERNAILSLNSQRLDGSVQPYLEMPFQNGNLPTNQGLPLLSDYAVIMQLNAAQLNAYCTGYFPDRPVPHLLVDRQLRIRTAIGSHC